MHITFDVEGINQYLEETGNRTVKDVWLKQDGNSRFAFGNASITETGIKHLGKLIRNHKDGDEVPESFGWGSIEIPYKIESSIRRVLGKPNLTEIALESGLEPEHAAAAALTAHEIGHGQRNQLLPNLMVFAGIALTLGGVTSICETDWTYLLSDIKTALAGISIFYVSRVLQEFLANSFAEKHINEIAEFVTINTDSTI